MELGLFVDFLRDNPILQLNGLFSRDGVHGMLEPKDYESIDFVFLFICAYVGKVTEDIADKGLMKMTMMYPELLLEFYSRRSKRNTDFKTGILSLRKRVRELRYTMTCSFEDRWECGLFTTIFYPLDNLCDDLEKLSSIQCLYAAPYDHFNVF